MGEGRTYTLVHTPDEDILLAAVSKDGVAHTAGVDVGVDCGLFALALVAGVYVDFGVVVDAISRRMRCEPGVETGVGLRLGLG
jgi:hypothetical protein